LRFQLLHILLFLLFLQIKTSRCDREMFGVRRPRLRLEDSQELLQHAGENVVKGGRNLWHGFTDWALQVCLTSLDFENNIMI